MANRTSRLGLGVARELALSVVNWMLAMTGLFVLYVLAPGDPVEMMLGARASPSMRNQVRRELGLDQPLPIQWLDWLVSAATLDYGYSIYYQVPVRDLLLGRLGSSLVLFTGIGVVGVTATVLAIVVVRGAQQRGLGGIATNAAVGASSVAPLLGVTGLLWLVVTLQLDFVGGTGEGGPAGALILAVLVGGTLTFPLVGLLARRFQVRLAAGDVTDPLAAARSMLAPGLARNWSLDLWLAATYLVGAVVLVEQVFAVNGVGRLWMEAAINRDLFLTRGVTAFVIHLAVVGWLARNLLLVVAQEVVGPGGTDPAAGTRPTVPDGGQPNVGAAAGSPRAVVRDAFARRRTQVGGAGVALALVAGLLGSVLLAPEQLSFGGGAQTAPVATGPGHALNTLGTLMVVVLVATAVATVPGAVLGVVAGRLGRPAATAFRVPVEVPLLFPLQLLVGYWIAMGGSITDRLGFELVVGAFGGLVLSGYAFHAARVAAENRRLGAGEVSAADVTGALVTAVGRTLGVTPLVVFVVAELAYIGFGLPRTASAFVQLARLTPYLTSGGPGLLVSGFATVVVPLALSAVPLALLGDGLVAGASAAARPRAAESEPEGRDAETSPATEPTADEPLESTTDEPTESPDVDEMLFGTEPPEPADEDRTPSGTEPAAGEQSSGPAAESDTTGPEPDQPSGRRADSAQASEMRDGERASARPGPPTTVPRAPDLPFGYDDVERVERIGTGGNADVYLGRVDGREVAMKEPRFDDTMHRDAVERFVEEAETWAKLDDHDHVVGVVEWGDQPLPWIALEFMDAGHLGGRAGEMPVDQSLWTAASVVRGVYHAHRRGVAHLDLKPANVLLRSVDGAWDVPKVADWGLAEFMLDHSHSVEGLSPQYAAPEQFDPDEYGRTDQVTDVYQLGAVFYELFTGETPFEGQSAQVMRAVMNEEPTPPSEVEPSLPDGLDDVLGRCLAKRKEDRYETVLYLRDDLEELYEAAQDG